MIRTKIKFSIKQLKENMKNNKVWIQVQNQVKIKSHFKIFNRILKNKLKLKIYPGKYRRKREGRNEKIIFIIEILCQNEDFT